MCTGSGCILGLLHWNESFKGIGDGFREERLAVAKANQEALAPENVTDSERFI